MCVGGCGSVGVSPLCHIVSQPMWVCTHDRTACGGQPGPVYEARYRGRALRTGVTRDAMQRSSAQGTGITKEAAMASHDWFLLVRGERLDMSNYMRFTVNAALRWPLPTSDRQGLGENKPRPRQPSFICNVATRSRCYPPGHSCRQMRDHAQPPSDALATLLIFSPHVHCR